MTKSAARIAALTDQPVTSPECRHLHATVMVAFASFGKAIITDSAGRPVWLFAADFRGPSVEVDS